MYEAPDNGLFELWSDNWLPVHVFADLMTQWNTEAGRLVGLRYEALPFVMRLHAVPAEQERTVFNAIRILERETVSQVNNS